MKKFYILCALLMATTALSAQQVTIAEATDMAARFCQTQHLSHPHLQQQMGDKSAADLYIFNADGGFVVIAGDKRANPILAFSTEGELSSQPIPPVQMWLDNYAEQIKSLKEKPFSPTDIHRGWDSREPLRSELVVAPLLRSRWGQGAPYNYYCPRDFDGINGRCVTGCVATALGQIMYYFRFPESGTGSYTYNHEVYGTQSVNYEESHYNYDAMCDRPTDVNTAIAQLIYDCGVGMDMDYGPDGSGVHNHSAGRVLRNHFKYNPATISVFRDSTTMDWDSLLTTHLLRRIPLYYAGWSVPDVNGHGYVCDGYQIVDSSNYYHFNFGWNGQDDAYFLSDAINTSGTHFNLLQEIVINAYPDTAQYVYPELPELVGSKEFTTRAGSFGLAPEEGTIDFQWVIAPDEAGITSITLELDFAIAEGDTLWVSAPGTNLTSYTYTADTATNTRNWNCEQLLVRLVSHNTAAPSSVNGSYQANIPRYCSEYSHAETGSGHYDDGSGTDDYLPLTTCAFKLKATGFPHVNLHFTHFDLEEGHDFLYIFYKKPTAENLLATYTGTMPDTVIYFEDRELYILFETDEFGNADGFAFDYQGTTEIIEFDNCHITIFPNPAHDRLHLLTNADAMNCEIAIYDIYGRCVSREIATGEAENTVDIAALTAGIYIVKLIQDDHTITAGRFVKQ